MSPEPQFAAAAIATGQDIAVHALVGSIAFLFFIFLFAALERQAWPAARKQAVSLLSFLASALPKSTNAMVAKVFGLGGSGLLIMLAGYGFGFLGQALAPPAASLVSFWGVADARLWVSRTEEVRNAEGNLQKYRGDSADQWDRFQTGLGRLPVRLTRGLLAVSALLVLGALVDLSASSYRKRGWLLLAAALVLVPLLTLIWCRTQGEYVRQLRIECERASPPIAFPNLVTAGAGASRSMNW